jgi:uncharacterized membrane protein
MYTSVLGLHSYIAYAVLGLLLIASINAFAGLASKRAFNANDRKISLIALAFAHTQLVLGFVLLFLSPYMESAKQAGMGAVMKNAQLRQMVVEHPVINLIAVILITIGWSKHKKEITDTNKFKRIAYLYAIAVVLLLSRIPWSQWLS